MISTSRTPAPVVASAGAMNSSTSRKVRVGLAIVWVAAWLMVCAAAERCGLSLILAGALGSFPMTRSP